MNNFSNNIDALKEIKNLNNFLLALESIQDYDKKDLTIKYMNEYFEIKKEVLWLIKLEDYEYFKDESLSVIEDIKDYLEYFKDFAIVHIFQKLLTDIFIHEKQFIEKEELIFIMA